MLEKINLLEKAQGLALFEYGQAGRMNGHVLSVLRAENRTLDFHVHQASDELFYCLEGAFQIELEDGVVPLAQGDLLIIPRGTRHRPVVTTPVTYLLMELDGTLSPENTGGSYK